MCGTRASPGMAAPQAAADRLRGPHGSARRSRRYARDVTGAQRHSRLPIGCRCRPPRIEASPAAELWLGSNAGNRDIRTTKSYAAPPIQLELVCANAFDGHIGGNNRCHERAAPTALFQHILLCPL